MPLSLEELAAAYKRQRNALLEIMKNSDVSSGVCCCGDSMERHADPMNCGHNPVDMWDHSVFCAMEDIKKFDEENQQ